MKTNIYYDAFYRKETSEVYTAVFLNGVGDLKYEGRVGTSSAHGEWLAALSALEYCVGLLFESGGEMRPGDITLIGDATAVTSQMENPERLEHNATKRNPRLVRFQKYALQILAEIGPVRWGWISTDDNPAGQLIRDSQEKGLMKPRGILG